MRSSQVDQHRPKEGSRSVEIGVTTEQRTERFLDEVFCR
jgi:hypothetical protein